ncbi:hypothetical protein [Streptomyces sp. NPDC091268]|uniref:hypothetical protein n=1 Tax=Streptomyces sp. NPDC091268 TaxID=3365979 RepID=UPI003828804A
MREQGAEGWWGPAPGAEAVAAAQLLLLLAGRLALPDPHDDHGLDGGQFALVPYLLGALLLPVLVPAAAFLHAACFTRPAIALARRTGRPGAAPAWIAAASALCALLPGAPGASYAVSWACLAGFGILPLRVALRARRLGRPPRSVVRAAARTTALLLVAALVGGTVLGWAVRYRPPRLERAAYVGEWRDGRGGVLRLNADGVATVRELPVQAEGPATRYCTAAGRWTHRPAGGGPARRAGVDLDLPGCPGDRTDWSHWQVGGTARRPELFHLDGDPDAGAMRLLRRAGPVDGVAPTG